ncbi:hypothetical protein [Nostoc sp.]|uniref:hypothetical protein n=1 Tax=Nostoc sp. TaxID=1180 RepID=UPI002FF8596F
MSKNTQITSKKQDKSLLSKISKLLNNSIVQTIIGGVFLLLIEYKIGVFQEVKRNSNYSGSPLWVDITTLTTIFIFIYFLKCLRIHFNYQNYFREEFSSAVLSTIILLIISLVLSISGQQMFWYPLVAVSYIVSSQKLTVSQTSWEGYAFLSVLIMLFYFIAFIRHQNWDGLKSIQQHQRDQRSEPSNIFSEGIGEFKRILNHWGTLEKYSESDYTQLLNPLEQSEDLISQAWKEQARELLRLSSSSYVIDQESGWHDKQGCWVGRNIDTGKLFFIYPAQAKLSKQDLDNFVRYSREFAKSQNCQISELIVAFRENRDKSLTPTDSYKDIRFETERNLLEKLVNFTDYSNNIHKRVLINKLPESALPLDDVYVSSQLLISKKKRADENVEDYL